MDEKSLDRKQSNAQDISCAEVELLGDRVGLYSDIQRYSIHDGPGIRTSVFLKGCPLKCAWCHNPENQSFEPEIYLWEDRCIRCKACAQACPGSGRAPGEIPDGGGSGCILCGRCVDACVAEARRLVGQPISVRDLVAILERQRPFYEESGGGVTFSGGEPLIQGDFLLACLKTLRKHKIHTAVDTCGFADTELILEVARCADLFLYDLKIMDEALHQKYTKAPLEPILRNLAAIDEAGSKIWIRVPVIPGINDDKDNIAAIGEFVSRLKNTRKLYLLPFHRFGSDKYRRLKMPYLLDKIEPPSVQTMEKIASYLAGFGLEIYIKSAHESKSTASTRTKP